MSIDHRILLNATKNVSKGVQNIEIVNILIKNGGGLKALRGKSKRSLYAHSNALPRLEIIVITPYLKIAYFK